MVRRENAFQGRTVQSEEENGHGKDQHNGRRLTRVGAGFFNVSHHPLHPIYSKDGFTSNTLRSVPSEVYGANKTANEKISSPIIHYPAADVGDGTYHWDFSCRLLPVYL